MKTNHITLRENEALTALSVYSARTIDDLRNTIMNGLIESDLIQDTPEICGETLQYVFQENGMRAEQFAVYHFNVSSPKITTLLNRLQVWGVADQCENCGCAMHYDDISEHEECINDVCGCSISVDYTPDPDAGRDDRCHYALIETIHKN